MTYAMTVRDARKAGKEYGQNLVSWMEIPELGQNVWTCDEGYRTVTAANLWDVMQSLAYMADDNNRQFWSRDPITLDDCWPVDRDGVPIVQHDNEIALADAWARYDELWAAYDEGIYAGISEGLRKRRREYGVPMITWFVYVGNVKYEIEIDSTSEKEARRQFRAELNLERCPDYAEFCPQHIE